MKPKLLLKLKHNLVPSSENNFHPRFFQAEILAIFLTLAILLQVFVFTGVGSRIIASFPSFSNLAAVLPAILAAETNEYRVENAVTPLQENVLLSEAATLKAQDMAKRGYFSHIDPDGDKPWKWISKTGYQYTYAGENLAIDFIDSKDVTDAWIASRTHRSNLVNSNFTQFGIGVANGIFENKPTTFVVQFFATPAEANIKTVTPTKTPKISNIAKNTVKTSTTTKSNILASTATVASPTNVGQVLGVETTDNQNLPKFMIPSESATVLGTIVYSSKRISLSTIEILILMFVTTLLFSVTYSIAHHPAGHPRQKVVLSLIDHRKTILYSFVFVGLLCLMLVIVGVYLSSAVRI